MNLPPLVIIILVGIVAGALAGLVTGRGLGLIGNLIVGILGGFVGTWLLPKVGVHFSGDLLGSVLTSAIGAVVLLVLIGLVSRR